jgi:hypothetical protein
VTSAWGDRLDNPVLVLRAGARHTIFVAEKAA